MTKKIIITLVVLILLALIVIKAKSLLDSKKEEINNEPLPQSQRVTIPVMHGKDGEMSSSMTFLAQIAADKSIQISTKLSGYVENLYVDESQVVNKGDQLVSIDAIDIHSNIDALKTTLSMQKSDLSLAKSIHNRNRKLHNVGGLAREKLDISAQALEAKKSLVKNTLQKISQFKNQLTYLTIKAPFDGTIDKVFLHEGDLAVTGKPILSMSDGVKKLLFSYATSDSQKIKKGLSAWIEKEMIGHIKSLHTTSSNGLLTAEIELSKDINLPVGASIDVDILTQKASGCIVPANTLLHKKDGIFVMVDIDGKFVPQKVTVIMRDDDKILLEVCPKDSIAYGSEIKLSQLPIYNNVQIVGAESE